MSLNKVMLIGNIGVITEAKDTKAGGKFINFSLATNKKTKNSDGEYEKATEWHNIIAFGKTAEFIGTLCKVGTKVYVEGEIQSSKYKDKEGLERTSYKILCNHFDLLASGKEKEEQPVTQLDSSPKQNEIFDDDIPF
jgi:single-strand DNA-binding protein